MWLWSFRKLWLRWIPWFTWVTLVYQLVCVAFRIPLDPINHFDPLGQPPWHVPSLWKFTPFLLSEQSDGKFSGGTILLFGGNFLWYWPWFSSFVTPDNSTHTPPLCWRCLKGDILIQQQQQLQTKGSTVRWLQHSGWVMLAIEQDTSSSVNTSKDGCHATDGN